MAKRRKESEPIVIMYEQCPACGSVWGHDEFDFQQCDACNYPNNSNEGLFEGE
jgi:hypothetical protein